VRYKIGWSSICGFLAAALQARRRRAREALARVTLAVGRDLLGGWTVAGGGCGLGAPSPTDRGCSPLLSLSSLISALRRLAARSRSWRELVCGSGPGESLGWLAQPSGGGACGRRSSSLEAWLRSPVSTPTNLPGESPKSLKLGGVDVMHAVSSLEASPGECDAG
jgi:hypothetical protein